MPGVFKETVDVMEEEEKKSLFDIVEEEMFRLPEYIPKEAPIKALFWGGDGTGKSGTAIEILETLNLEEGERLVVIDLDVGNEPSSLSYHREEYKRGNLVVWNPMEWKEVEKPDGSIVVELDYMTTMSRIKAAGIRIKQRHEKYKVRAVVLDGLSTLLKHAEWQMRIEKNLDVSGGVSQRYWVSRNKSFLEMLQLYKSIPLDVIFVGNANFGIDENDPDVSKIYLDVNDLMFQKVHFYVVETPEGIVEFWGKIEKSKQNLKNRGRKIKFAEVDLKNEEADYYWDPTKIIKLLRPDPKAKNRAKKEKAEKFLSTEVEE